MPYHLLQGLRCKGDTLTLTFAPADVVIEGRGLHAFYVELAQQVVWRIVEQASEHPVGEVLQRVRASRIDRFRDRWQRPCVKAKKERIEKPSPGTVLAAKYRARGNQLGDAEREKLGEEFLKLYYGRPVPTGRRR